MTKDRVQIQIPEAFEGLFEPHRYKVFYGGRGGAKSHNIARYLLIEGMKEPKRFLCARELQGSITDSVHKLLSDIIDEHGLGEFYEVQKANIKGVNGTEFFFKGLKHNATEIKSMEGVDKVWVEEAEKVSSNSWEILIPTIRKEGSEIIISFNPKHPTDPTYVNFVANADSSMLVKKVSWQDNPFFPDTLRLERDRLRVSDPKAYAHVWEGDFDERHFGGVLATQLDRARQEGRICPIPYKHGHKVYTAWDLGKGDSTVIFFAQKIGLQPRVIDFYENFGKEPEFYAGIIRNKPYKNYEHWMPHDAFHERLGQKAGSLSNQFRELGIPNKMIVKTSKAARIATARTFVNECYISDSLSCSDGVAQLMNWQYEWDDNRQRFKDDPVHSDVGDSFTYLAQVFAKEERKQVTAPKPQAHVPVRSGSWMS